MHLEHRFICVCVVVSSRSDTGGDFRFGKKSSTNLVVSFEDYCPFQIHLKFRNNFVCSLIVNAHNTNLPNFSSELFGRFFFLFAPPIPSVAYVYGRNATSYDGYRQIYTLFIINTKKAMII